MDVVVIEGQIVPHVVVEAEVDLVVMVVMEESVEVVEVDMVVLHVEVKVEEVWH